MIEEVTLIPYWLLRWLSAIGRLSPATLLPALLVAHFWWVSSYTHTLTLLTGQPPFASLMRARLLAFALCCISSEARVAAGMSATSTVVSFPELAHAVANQDTSISVAAPFIRFTRQLNVRTVLGIESAEEAATVLSGGYSTRFFYLHEHAKLQLRRLDLTHGNSS